MLLCVCVQQVGAARCARRAQVAVCVRRVLGSTGLRVGWQGGAKCSLGKHCGHDHERTPTKVNAPRHTHTRQCQVYLYSTFQSQSALPTKTHPHTQAQRVTKIKREHRKEMVVYCFVVCVCLCVCVFMFVCGHAVRTSAGLRAKCWSLWRSSLSTESRSLLRTMTTCGGTSSR